MTFDYSFSNPSPMGGDGPVDATAAITISGSTITVVLTSLEPSPTFVPPGEQAGQLISGITFDLTGATGASLSASLGTSAVVPGGATTTGTLGHWGLSFSGGALALQTAGNAAGMGTPTYMIIGPDDTGNPNSFNTSDYNVGSSITMNHEPVVLGSATFTITTTGDATGISDVQLGFGTGPDFTSPTLTNTHVPDGASTAMLLGFATLGMGWVRARFIRK